ncbi:MAG: 50S ribosomal protein P1 [Nitrososphaeraceae archaeon]|nr:50S ribosomal protein P1 [Nitrososphaeraceae archaeon]
MEYVYAALLLHKLKQDITEDNITNVIKAAGTTPDEVRIKALVAALGDVNIDEALKSAPMAVAPAAQPSSEATKETPEKKEEPKEEKKEEEALEGLSSLFG